MHVFVRSLEGQSLSFEADTTATLLYDVSDRTGIPTVESRLTYNGRQLTSSNESLSSYGITSGATIGLALRLRGGGPKKRCGHYIAATERCSSVSLRIVGDCNFCEVSFCGRHRLPEDHACPNLQSCRNEAFLKNKNKLEAEMTTQKRGIEGI